MINLYDLSKADNILKSKRNWKIFLIILGILVLTTLTLFSIFFSNNLVMVINMIIAFLYMSLLFTYVKLINKDFNEQYHMLAKIQHYNHETIKGNITYIDDMLTTINTFETFHMKVEERSFYVDSNKVNVFETFKLNMKVKVIIVDNILIAYEVINDD